MKPKEFAAAVIVAMISLCGVLGAALIYNWTDLFPAQATSTPQVVSLPAAPTIHVPDVVTVPATPTTYVPEIIFLPPTSTETALPTPTEVPEFNLFDHAQYATWTSNDDNNKTAPWMSMTYKILVPLLTFAMTDLRMVETILRQFSPIQHGKMMDMYKATSKYPLLAKVNIF